jgi:branched-chain amino acid transport system substrate-binding protein
MAITPSISRRRIVASGSVDSPKLIELAGDAANGVFTVPNFFPSDSRPEARAFVSRFKAKRLEETTTATSSPMTRSC